MKRVYASSLVAVMIGALSSGVFATPSFAKDATAGTTKAAAKKNIDCSITKLTSPVKPGDDAMCTIKTEPNALCKIEVKLKSGASKAAALKAQHADDKGVATWNWKIAPNAAVGDWPVTIDCSLKGAKGSASGTLKIAK
ncbi:MAG TPA: hypothetical protein V6C97_16600 [Oculatellaceae cyanobacterium]